MDYPPQNQVASNIKKLLESRHDREVLDGMRKVISVGPAALFVFLFGTPTDTFFFPLLYS